MFRNMATILNEGQIGKYQLKKFVIEEAPQNDIRFLMSSSFREYMHQEPGEFIKLIDDKQIIMSDTEMERRTNRNFVDNAKGDVLIAGLGIGMVLFPLVEKPEVTSITIIEVCDEIIDLVWPQLVGCPTLDLTKVRLIKDNIFLHIPDKNYDTIYFDIWNTISEDNLEDMVKLFNRFKPYHGGEYIWAWRYDDCLMQRFECDNCNGNCDCQYCDGGSCEYCENGVTEDGDQCDYCDGEGLCIECEGSGTCLECDGIGIDLYEVEEFSPIPITDYFC